ncbi:MAG TPA: hypothetical protein VGX23_30635 [Actinocrinis sp.]|nr:hypothetical protein [Actinocrinis sp.]
MTVTELRLRGILDSRAEVTLEAELTLDGAFTARGSCPRAIAPGRRERPIGGSAALGALPDQAEQLLALVGGPGIDGQAGLDAALAAHTDAIGVSATLAVSVAYARAAAAAQDTHLWRYLADLAGSSPALPALLVNVFSGGIHSSGPPDGYQQVMVIPRTGSLVGDIDAACRVWSAAYALAAARFGEPRLSASSGISVPVDSAAQLDLLDQAIERCGLAGSVSVGVDVAAEHLYADGAYRLAGRTLTPADLAEVLTAQTRRYGLTYIEDPFDPADEEAWRSLRAALPAAARVIGDDLFASDAERIDPGLADGVLLKPSQIGTVSGLVRAAARARRAGMAIAVSHRSGETDDTVICDVAAALGADLIKVGGPRRGDRLAKYNQLLRLAEHVPAASPTALLGDHR